VDLRTLDLNLLVTFERIVAERSVTRAASQLGLTQSAVSHALARLRRAFGDDLMVRGPVGLEPTARALEIAAVLGRSLGDIERVLDRESFDAATSTRRFTFHISDYVAPFLLPALCARLRRLAPNASVDVRHFAEKVDVIEPGELHVRIADGLSPQRSEPGVERHRLLEDSFVVMMSRDHPAAAVPGLTLEQYLALSHVKVMPAALGTGLIDDELARRGLRRRIAVTVPSWFAMRSVVAATDLVVAMPRRWADDPTFAGGCVWRPLPLESPAFAADLCWRSRDHHDPGHRWLREQVVAALAD